MGVYKQLSFSGGMDLISSDTDIAAQAYRQAFNVRQRYGYMQTIPKALNITYNLSGAGKFQALIATNNIWIAFMGGRAYWMHVGANTWLPILGVQLDSGVNYIYTQAVPDSTNNYLRQAILAGNGNVDSSAGIITATSRNGQAFTAAGTPTGIVCQDGINQPAFIEYDPITDTIVGRQLQTYNQWSNDGSTTYGMEYVPIGTLMMYLSPILYVVKGNQVFRSCSGQPLNFMVNVDDNGNKLATEDLGGALTTAFAVSNETITCITPATTTTNAFIIGTGRFTYGLQPDLSVTIFGEPTFDTIFTYEAGIVNQFSTTDSNGDTPFIDFEGIGFFNAVQTIKFQGRNDIRSKNIAVILANISQSVCCASVYNNFNYFGLNTIYGYAMAIYDNMTNLWVSIDITLPCAGGVKMFAEANTTVLGMNNRFFACGNGINQIWLLDATDGSLTATEEGTVFTRSALSGAFSPYGIFIYNPLTNEHKLRWIKVAILPSTVAGNIYCTSYVDGQTDQVSDFLPIPAVVCGIPYPVSPPVIPANMKQVINRVFSFDQGLTGYKIGSMISWNGNAKIARVECFADDKVNDVSESEQQLVIANQ